jgi:hypothetical protein
MLFLYLTSYIPQRAVDPGGGGYDGFGLLHSAESGAGGEPGVAALTLKAAQALVQLEVSLLSEVPCDSPAYRMWEVEQTYGGVAQRWVLIETLMIYTLAERKLRQALEDQNQTVRDQRKQPTAQPTFRWIMQKFQGIHWINLEGQRQISNLTDERRLIIRLLGPPVERYYHPSD